MKVAVVVPFSQIESLRRLENFRNLRATYLDIKKERGKLNYTNPIPYRSMSHVSHFHYMYVPLHISPASEAVDSTNHLRPCHLDYMNDCPSHSCGSYDIMIRDTRCWLTHQ